MKARILIIALTLIAIGGCEQERETRCYTLEMADGKTETVEGLYPGHHKGRFVLQDKPLDDASANVTFRRQGVVSFTSVAGPCPCEPGAPGKPVEGE